VDYTQPTTTPYEVTHVLDLAWYGVVRVQKAPGHVCRKYHGPRSFAINERVDLEPADASICRFNQTRDWYDPL